MGSYKVTRIWLDPVAKYSVPLSLAAPEVAKVTRRVLNRSRVLTPVRTGNLKNSQQMTMRAYRTKVVGTVSTRVKYAHYVHDGTDPHRIVARRGHALVFEMDGVLVFRRSVMHPGTRGRPFMRRALSEEGNAAGFRVTGYSARGGSVGFRMTG